MIEFKGWPKTPRFFRDITITEKIDGTNAAVIIEQHPFGTFVDGMPDDSTVVIGSEIDDAGMPQFEYVVGAQSRNRIITPGKSTDNAGFAGWVYENANALVTTLGAGYHYGEWWGQGIQRNYGLDHKRFSLFNVHRYAGLVEVDGVHQVVGLDVVPVLYQGPNSEEAINMVDLGLRDEGSQAAPGFNDPEGFIVYHSASRQVYKVLLENDHLPKGAAA